MINEWTAKKNFLKNRRILYVCRRVIEIKRNKLIFEISIPLNSLLL